MFLGGLSYKAFSTICVTLSAVIGTILGEGLTNQWGSATLAGVIGSSTVGLFLVIPRIMEQRRKSKESVADIAEKITTDAFKRIMDVHKAELDFFKQKLADMGKQVADKEMIAVLERSGKHKAVNEWTGALAHIAVIERQLVEAGHKPAKEYTPKAYIEVIGEEDKQIKQVQRESRETAAAVAALPTAA